MDKIDEVIARGVEQIYPSQEALNKVLHSGKKLRIYQGFDPSMPNLHLGSLVGLVKLRQFQDLGHEVIFLVGDFTGMIGDPTDKSTTRPKLTRKQTLENSRRWKEQAGKVLNFDGKNPARMLFNSQWLDKIGFKDLIEITSNFTVQQMLERDFFQKRLKEGKPIFLHEFLYPVAQAIDCVAMEVDMEIGGNDQTFNMLAGRTLMKAVKGKEKFVLSTKLLVDSAGKKVGKTTGNALFLDSSPAEMFGGVMSFPDEVILLSFELLTLVPLEEIKAKEGLLQSNKVNPMDLKKELAFEIVKMCFSENEAQKAVEEFEKVFQRGETDSESALNYTPQKNETITDILFNAGATVSRSAARRLIEQGGVDFNGTSVVDPQQIIGAKTGIIKAGKRRFIKLTSKG